MAKRWLKARVTRTCEADVYLCVDDEKVELKPYHHPPREFLVTPRLRVLAEQAATICVPESAWPESAHVRDAREVTEGEAEGNALGVLVFDVSEWHEKYLPPAGGGVCEGEEDVSVGLPRTLRSVGRVADAAFVCWMAILGAAAFAWVAWSMLAR